VKELPPELAGVSLAGALQEVTGDADAIVVCTECRSFEGFWAALTAKMRRKLVVDANRFLDKQLQG